MGSLPQSNDMHIRLTEHAYLPVALNMRDVNSTAVSSVSSVTLHLCSMDPPLPLRDPLYHGKVCLGTEPNISTLYCIIQKERKK